MTVKWGNFTKLDGRNYRQIEIASVSDLKVFEKTAGILSGEMGGSVIDKIEGIGQRYWHYEFSGIRLVLHLEHYKGIVLYPASEENATKEELDLLESLFAALESVF